MNGFAYLSANDRRDVFTETAARRRLSPVIVEKDFWVCWTLRQLFALPGYRDHLVFKGGTSLSKAYGAIDRFSEDIDVSIDETILGIEPVVPSALSKNQRQKRFERIRLACEEYVGASLMPALGEQIGSVLGTMDHGGWSLASLAEEPATVIFEYPSAIETRLVYIQPSVRLEFGSGVDPWPTLLKEVTPSAAEEFPSLFNERTATVTCLEIERTFWEKATIVHMMNTRTREASVSRMSRHCYDLTQLRHSPYLRSPSDTLDLLRRVADHKASYFPTAGVDYMDCYSGKLHLAPQGSRLSAMREDYAAMRAMFFGAVIPFDTILDGLAELEGMVNDAAASAVKP